MMGYKKYILLGIFILGFFVLASQTMASIPDDPDLGPPPTPSSPTASGSFVLTCRADGSPISSNQTTCTGHSSPVIGQMWEWQYQMIQQDEPAAEVKVCINNSGVMDDGHCWFVQYFKDNNILNTSGDRIAVDDFRTFTHLVATIRIENGGTANDGDHSARFTYYGRTATVDNLAVSPASIQTFGSSQLSWRSSYMFDQEIIYEDTNGAVSMMYPGKANPGRVNQSYSQNYTNGGVAGTAGFRLKTWGPNENGVYTGYEVDFPTVTVSGGVMSGTIRSDFATCTKSGSNQCDVVLNHTTKNVTFAEIDKDSELGWRTIDQNVVPAGTTVDVNPAPGTHVYKLIGQASGPAAQLASVTVIIYPDPDDNPPVIGGPTCSPSLVSANINTNQTFTATGGNGTYSWSGGGSPATGTGSSFTTAFATAGTRTITVTSNGLTHSCTFEVMDNGTPPPPQPDPVVCAPANSSLQVFQAGTFTATGGNGTYSWAGGGSPLTGSGSSFSTSYTTPGTKTITVTSNGISSNCVVQVIASSCPALNSPSNGAVLPVGTYQPTFTYNSASGRTNYILDITTDPSWAWWWNNGTGAAGDGQTAASLPITFGITTQYTSVTNNYYAEGRAVPAQLQSGVTYYWRVYGFNSSDLSAGGCHSATYSFSIAANVPVFVINYEPAQLNRAENLTASNSICRQVTLNWTYVNNGVGQGYTVYRSTSGNAGTFSQIYTAANLVNRSYVDNDASLVSGQTYYYRVDYYTNVAPARTNASEVVNTTVVGCTADFSSSTYNITAVNGVAYSTQTSKIKNGDTVSFRITLSNLGPAEGVITSLMDTVSDNLINPRNYQVNKGSGNAAGSLSGSTATLLNMNLSGRKCVSPGNTTGCATAVDPSCVTSPSNLCNNWVLSFDATVSIQTDAQNDAITGVARLAFTDGRAGTNYQDITLSPHIFETDRRIPPDFREVAP